jgi:hydroxymethylglutaryl-CoA reductase (NADPH)
MSFDAKTAKKARKGFISNVPLLTTMQIAENSILSSQVAYSLENMTHFLTHQFPTSSGKKFTDICHSVQNSQDGDETCFTSTFSGNPKSESLMLSFAAGGREDFIGALTKQGAFISEDFGPVKYVVENPEQDAVAGMKSGKWVAYAARTLVVRFWDLTKVSMVQSVYL